MRHLLLTLPALAALLTASRAASAQTGSGSGASPDSASAARELYRLEDAWTAAVVRRDARFFERNLAPGYLYTDERGVFTKPQVIKEQTTGSDSVTYSANETMHASVYGTAAVVTGILVTRGRGANGSFQHRYRYTDTFVRRDGRWMMVASQDYEIPKR